MLAELLGKSNGYCKGKGGSMHIADKDIGVFGANGIVGGGVAIACGLALANSFMNNGVAVTFFGEGASNQGILYESINMSAIWNLPVIFVCENNMYAQTTPAKLTIYGNTVSKRANGFGIEDNMGDGDGHVYHHERLLAPAVVEYGLLRASGYQDPCGSQFLQADAARR